MEDNRNRDLQKENQTVLYRQFGRKEEVEYYNRPGAYIVPIKDGKVAVVKIPKGTFLIGGGIESGETEEQCIRRECMEEIGYTIRLVRKIGWAESYTLHSALGYFHPTQHYYEAELLEKVKEPIEKDHFLCWIPADEIKGKMFSDMQNWAVEQAVNQIETTITE